MTYGFHEPLVDSDKCIYSLSPQRRGSGKTVTPFLPPSIPFLSLPPAGPLWHNGAFHFSWRIVRVPICLLLTGVSHGSPWEPGGGQWGTGKRRAEDRQELTSHYGDPGSSHQTAHWFQMLHPCTIVTHTCTQARYLPLVLDFLITSGHSGPLTSHRCSSQMIGRFGAELESPPPYSLTLSAPSVYFNNSNHISNNHHFSVLD